MPATNAASSKGILVVATNSTNYTNMAGLYVPLISLSFLDVYEPVLLLSDVLFTFKG